MIKKRIWIFIISLFLCFNIFPKAKKIKIQSPKWINEPYSFLEKERFFAVVGNDKNKNTAELKAVEELASIFGRDIKSNTIAESIMNRTEQEHVSTLIQEQNLNQQILVTIDQRNLIGIEILETFFDEKKEIWYALAVLDKKKTSDIYSNEIKLCYQTIKDYFNASKESDLTFDKLSYIYKCKQTAQYTQSLLLRLQVIDFNTAENLNRNDYSENRFSIEFNNIANTIPICIKINEDYNDEIKNVCAQVFEAYGFKIVNNSNYVLEIFIDNSYRTVTNPDAVYCESILSIKLNGRDGSIYFPFNYSSRAGAKNEKLALQKEYALLCSVIQSDYKKQIQTILLKDE